MYFYLIGQIVKSDNQTKITNISIRQYSYAPAMNNVITDYRVSTRVTDQYPFIIGKCNVSTPSEKNVLARTLTGTITFERLKSFAGLFPNGFMIDSKYRTEEEISKILTDDIHIKGSKVLWKVGF